MNEANMRRWGRRLESLESAVVILEKKVGVTIVQEMASRIQSAQQVHIYPCT